MPNKKAQVWVETVIYTLIAFILIGAVLAYARPKIEEFQDKTIIEQTINAAENINTIVNSIIQKGAGNKRIIEIGIKKGTLKIDGENDKLFFEIESRYFYSETGQEVKIGNVIIETQEKGKLSLITISLDYSQKYDIVYEDKNTVKLINKAATPYRIAISNKGKTNGKTKIDFQII
ncbi:hypothetical protein ACFLZF_00025 [Nanoarchaeota archaeon]